MIDSVPDIKFCMIHGFDYLNDMGSEHCTSRQMDN